MQFPNVKFIQGTLPQSLSMLRPEPIKFLHIDLNAPEIEIECLDLLWNHIMPSGIILIDDFAYNGYEYTHKLFTEFCRQKDISIMSTAYGPGIIIK